MQSPRVQESILKAAKWAYLAQSVNQLVRPLVTLVIARLLTPEDFGIVALVSGILGTANLVWSFGLATALIQRENDIDVAANITFWVNGIMAFLLFCVLVVGRESVAMIFREPKIAEILPYMAVPVLLDGLSVAQNALLQKQLAYSRLFWRSTLPSVVPWLVTLPLAIAGYGYWALVWGTVMGSVIGNVTLWVMSSWRPSLCFDQRVAREMIIFGVPTLGESFQGWLINQADRVVIGWVLGIRELGIYSLGNTLYSMVYSFVFAPVRSVGYASMCRPAGNLSEQKRLFLSGQEIVALFVIPLGAGLVVISPIMEHVVFANRYPGLGHIINLLALYYIFSYAQSLIAPFFRAVGRPNLALWLNLLTSVLILILYPLSSMYGLDLFLIARGMISAIVGIVALWIIQKVFFIGILQQLKPFGVSGLASGAMVIGVLTLGFVSPSVKDWSGWVLLIGTVIVGVVLYLLVLRAISYDSLKRLLVFARTSFAK